MSSKCTWQRFFFSMDADNAKLLLFHLLVLLANQLPVLLLPQQRQHLVQRSQHLIHLPKLNIQAAVTSLLVFHPPWLQLRSSVTSHHKPSWRPNRKHLTTFLPPYLIRLLVLPLPQLSGSCNNCSCYCYRHLSFCDGWKWKHRDLYVHYTPLSQPKQESWLSREAMSSKLLIVDTKIGGEANLKVVQESFLSIMWFVLCFWLKYLTLSYSLSNISPVGSHAWTFNNRVGERSRSGSGCFRSGYECWEIVEQAESFWPCEG